MKINPDNHSIPTLRIGQHFQDLDWKIRDDSSIPELYRQMVSYLASQEWKEFHDDGMTHLTQIHFNELIHQFWELQEPDTMGHLNRATQELWKSQYEDICA